MIWMMVILLIYLILQTVMLCIPFVAFIIILIDYMDEWRRK